MKAPETIQEVRKRLWKQSLERVKKMREGVQERQISLLGQLMRACTAAGRFHD